jgi:hypothetical protein
MLKQDSSRISQFQADDDTVDNDMMCIERLTMIKKKEAIRCPARVLQSLVKSNVCSKKSRSLHAAPQLYVRSEISQQTFLCLPGPIVSGSSLVTGSIIVNDSDLSASFGHHRVWGCLLHFGHRFFTSLTLLFLGDVRQDSSTN